MGGGEGIWPVIDVMALEFLADSKKI